MSCWPNSSDQWTPQAASASTVRTPRGRKPLSSLKLGLQHATGREKHEADCVWKPRAPTRQCTSDSCPAAAAGPCRPRRWCGHCAVLSSQRVRPPVDGEGRLLEPLLHSIREDKALADAGPAGMAGEAAEGAAGESRQAEGGSMPSAGAVGRSSGSSNGMQAAHNGQRQASRGDGLRSRPCQGSGLLRRPSHASGLFRRAGRSLVDLEGDHFSFGEVQGSFTSLVQHDYHDRGKGVYEQERKRLRLPALVETGRYAGRSRVEYRGSGIHYHLFKRDFFISVLQMPFGTLMATVAALYLLIYFCWGFIWWLLVRFYPGCVYGATTFVESWTLAIVTQMTIGYGNSGPQQCWAATAVITTQAISCTVILNAVTLGIIFSKVASPARRAFSIYISDTAVIARRDGILKLLFRVADVRTTQVIEPKVRAYLYTWGEGRVTSEGEYIPVRCEQLDLGYIDGMLLLPLIIEHTIDERSPLCGHTHDSLAAMNAEVVVTFEATTETGNPFFTRQSYLAQEIHWGCKFEEIIRKPGAGEEQPRYRIDLDRFHDVQCPEEMVGDEEIGDPRSHASQMVVNRAKRTVPYPLLGENTLVLSDLLCVRPIEVEGAGEKMELVCRVADTYPSQMLEVSARIYLYRWRPADWCREHPDRPTFTLHQLECGYRYGADRLFLRLPVELVHTIDASSPLASWLEAGGLSEDADSEIVVVLQGYLYQTGTNRMRQRTYRVGSHVRYGFRFADTVRAPSESRDGKPRVRWAHFFDVEPVGWGEGRRGKPTIHMHTSSLDNPALRAYLQRRTTLSAPESHAQVRAQQDRNSRLNHALDKPLSRSLRWTPVDPRAVEQATLVREHSLWGPAAAVAAAEAVAAEAAEKERSERVPRTAVPVGPALGPLQVDPALRVAADAMGRDSTVTPSSPMDWYEAMLFKSSMLPAGAAAAEAEEEWHHQHAPAESAAAAAAAEVEEEQQHHQQQHRAGSGARGSSRGRPVGPPDLSVLSAMPSVPLDRYEAALTRDSMQPAGSGRSTLGSGSGSTGTSAGLATAPAAAAPLRRLSPRFQPQPDLLPSDLTATPSVPMERYAAMVASAEEEEAEAGMPFGAAGRDSDGSSGSGSGSAASGSGVFHFPPHQQQQQQQQQHRAGLPPRPFPVPARRAVADVDVQRDASWHKRRSLANLAAIMEQEREGSRAGSRAGLEEQDDE